MIALVDYGMGNLRSVEKALTRAGGEVRIVTGPAGLRPATAAVLPGVGAFGDCLTNLAKANLTGAIREFIGSGKPFLGICLGFQGLFDSSEEAPGVRGLGVFRGTVPRFVPATATSPGAGGLKVPHMGWNQLRMKRPACPLLAGIPADPFLYFVHSYYCQPADEALVCGTTEYGVEFCSMIWSGNVYATQFHPEKSQAVGLRMLENFVNLNKN